MGCGEGLGYKKKILQRQHKEIWGLLALFIISRVIISQRYTYFKTYHIIDLKYVQFTVSQLYLYRAFKKILWQGKFFNYKSNFLTVFIRFISWKSWSFLYVFLSSPCIHPTVHANLASAPSYCQNCSKVTKAPILFDPRYSFPFYLICFLNRIQHC